MYSFECAQMFHRRTLSLFSDAFVKLRKVTISIAVSIGRSVRPHGTTRILRKDYHGI